MRFLCLLLGASLALAAFFIGYGPGSALRNVAFVFLAAAAILYIGATFVGSNRLRQRLIGLAPWW
jgi:hypothetical protein